MSLHINIDLPQSYCAMFTDPAFAFLRIAVASVCMNKFQQEQQQEQQQEETLFDEKNNCKERGCSSSV
jgi:hypothetical protein